MSSPKRKPASRKNAARNATPRGRRPRGVADWAPAFLAGLYAGNHVRDAAAIAGVDSSTAYRRRDHDEEFRKAWQTAYEVGTEALEAETTRRAYHGTLKPVFHRGKKIGEIREYSDTLLMFLLRARKPKMYRERFAVEASGKNGGPIIQLASDRV